MAIVITQEELKQKKIKETLKFHGIDKWHEMGYKGQGYNFLELESQDSEHGQGVIRTYNIVAPKANGFLGELVYRVSGDEVIRCDVYHNGKIINIKKFIKENNIHMVGASMSSKSGIGFPEPLIRYLKDIPVVYGGSAGNKGNLGVTGWFEYLGIMVGEINIRNEKIIKAHRSAVQDTLDFVTLPAGRSGTSFSFPVLFGIIALIFSKYGLISQESIYATLVSISKHLGEKGKNDRFGWGAPVLPENGKIKILENYSIEKPQEETENEEVAEEGEVKMNIINKDNLVVVLDPGHRRDTPGKRSHDFLEWEFNDEVVEKTRNLLKSNGYNTEITFQGVIHPFEETTLDGRTANLKYRCECNNYLKTKDNHVIFISVHANAHSNTSVRGYEIYTAYGEDDVNSELLADCMLNKAKEILGVGKTTPNRGSKDADFYVLKNTITPAVLIEHDFFTNKEAREELKTENYKNKAAKAILEGVELYIKKQNEKQPGKLFLAKESIGVDTIHLIGGKTPVNSYYRQDTRNDRIRYINSSPLNIMFAIGDSTVKETGKFGINGTFFWKNSVNGIMKFGDEILGERSSRYWSPDGINYPQSVLCFYKDNTFGVEKIKTAREISKPVWWAVGGIGLISKFGYNPDAEGFKKVWSKSAQRYFDYSDVLRYTNHISIGVDYSDRVYLIRSYSVYRKTTIDHGKLLNLKYMIGLDSGGSAQMVTPDWSRPSEYYEKNISPTRKVYNKILVKDL